MLPWSKRSDRMRGLVVLAPGSPSSARGSPFPLATAARPERPERSRGRGFRGSHPPRSRRGSLHPRFGLFGCDPARRTGARDPRPGRSCRRTRTGTRSHRTAALGDHRAGFDTRRKGRAEMTLDRDASLQPGGNIDAPVKPNSSASSNDCCRRLDLQQSSVSD